MSHVKHKPTTPEAHERAAKRCEDAAKHMAVAAVHHLAAAEALRAGDHAKAATAAAAAGEAHTAADSHLQEVAKEHPAAAAPA
jgi:hypothetical protein